MDTNIVGVGVGITDRFRSVVEEKLVRIEHLAPRAQRIDVKVTHRTYRTGRVEDHTVELTLTGKGPLVRAEATDADKFTALDMAVDKLCEQLRRAKDKRVDARNHPRKAMFDKERGELDGIDIQPASADVLRRVATGEVPIRLAMHPSGDFVVSSNFGSGDLTVIDTATNGAVRTIPVSGSSDAVQVTLVFSEDGERLYAAETATDTIAEIDFASGEVLRRLPTGPGGDGLAIID